MNSDIKRVSEPDLCTASQEPGQAPQGALRAATLLTPLVEPADWPKLEHRLRLDLPGILDFVGLCPAKNNIQAALDFLMERIQNTPGENRVRDYLNGWLEEFAQQTGRTLSRLLTDEAMALIIEETAIQESVESCRPENLVGWKEYVLDFEQRRLLGFKQRRHHSTALDPLTIDLPPEFNSRQDAISATRDLVELAKVATGEALLVYDKPCGVTRSQIA